jgi:hypothetical protein
MTHFVFLGPSLPHAQAQALHPQAVLLPPVAMGDLYTLVHTRARPGDVVAIVDGLFEQVPAVWHKEILFALEQGVHVWGASSMGALRAAELQPFGMRPVGRIAQAFASGELEDDDEVVVAHATAEQGFRSLSQAMVSLRHGLLSLSASAAVPQAVAQALVVHAKSLHYSQRSWAAVIAQARVLLRPEAEIQALKLQARQPDAKALDAITLLQELAAVPELPPFEAGFTLERTAFWQALVHNQHLLQLAGGGLAADARAVLAHARALDPRRHLWRQQALLLRLVEERAAGVVLPDAELQAAARRLAHRHGLRRGSELRHWREQQGLDDTAWLSLLRREALIQRELAARGPLLEADEALGLRQHGQWSDLQAQVGQARQLLAERGISKPTLADAGVDADALQAWYEQRCGAMLPTPERHAQALGFESLRDLVSELLAQHMLQSAASAAAEAA